MQVLKYAKLMGYVRIGLKGKYGQHGEGILIDQTQFGRCKYWLSQEKKRATIGRYREKKVAQWFKEIIKGSQSKKYIEIQK